MANYRESLMVHDAYGSKSSGWVPENMTKAGQQRQHDRTIPSPESVNDDSLAGGWESYSEPFRVSIICAFK